MKSSVLSTLAAALLCACAAVPPAPAAAANPVCTSTSLRAPADARIQRAVAEARRQHQLFGGQTIERNGGIFRVGYFEAEWSRPPGESLAAWERVATFWRALSESEPPLLRTSAGWVERSAAAPDGPVAGSESDTRQVAIREALLRAAIVDTPWSAAFISYLMKTAGFSRGEFAFSDTHADYVRAALDATAAEAAGRPATQAFRACDVATTRPRAGDLLCATRASTADVDRFDALPAAIAVRATGEAFPMHCELVVRSDEGGDAKLDTIGGNVVQSVTLTRMTLNARKVLSDQYITRVAPPEDCAGAEQGCRGHLNRRPWLVLLQFRN